MALVGRSHQEREGGDVVAELSVRVDSKGRLAIPKKIRQQLDVKPGDTFFLQSEGRVLRYAKAANPFDELADYALEQYRRGETKGLRRFAGERAARLDAK